MHLVLCSAASWSALEAVRWPHLLRQDAFGMHQSQQSKNPALRHGQSSEGIPVGTEVRPAKQQWSVFHCCPSVHPCRHATAPCCARRGTGKRAGTGRGAPPCSASRRRQGRRRRRRTRHQMHKTTMAAPEGVASGPAIAHSQTCTVGVSIGCGAVPVPSFFAINLNQ